MNVPRLAIRNYQFTLVAVGMLMLLGVQSFLTMPRTEDPIFDIATTRVVVVYPGAGPEDLERDVVDPLEEAISELEDLASLETSVQDGLAVIVAEFESYADADDSYDAVTQAVSEERPNLPPGVAAVELVRTSPADAVIFQVALTGEGASYRSLKREAERVETAFEQVAGVRRADVWAVPEPQVRVGLDVEAMRARGVGVGEVMGALQAQSVNLPGGSVEVGGRRFTLQTSGAYDSVEQIERTVVRGDAGGALYLRDVAGVALGYADDTYRARWNGTRAAFVTVVQRDGTNIFDVREGLEEQLGALRQSLPQGVELHIAFDQSESVESRVNGFFANLLQGVGLVGVVVLLALGWRAALIVMLVIPSSILIAINWLDLAGYGLQQISIVGLVIALGLLVDNAIVVVENVARYLQQGLSRNQAAARGTAEVAWPVVAATATSVLAFVPMISIQSGTGDFIRSMPLTVVFALATSLALALTLTPMLASRILRAPHEGDQDEAGADQPAAEVPAAEDEASSVPPRAAPDPAAVSQPKAASERRPPILQRALDRASDRVYSPLLVRALGRPGTVFVSAVLALVAAGALFPLIGVSLFPKSGKPQFLISLEVPDGMGIDATDAAARRVEAAVLGREEVRGVSSSIGRDNPRMYYNVLPRRDRPNVGQLLVELHDPDDVEPFVADLRPLLARLPGVDVTYEVFENGPPVEAPVAVKVLGPDLEELTRLAAEVERVVEATPGTESVANPLGQPRTDLAVRIDRDKAALVGVSVAEIDRTVLATMAGLPVGTYRDAEGTDHDIVVRMPLVDEAGRARKPSFDDLGRVAVAGHSGIVPLRQVADVAFEPVASRIDHVDLSRAVTVSSDVDVAGGYNEIAVTEAIMERLSGLDLPAGYRITYGGKLAEQQDSFGSLGAALIVALFGVFAVLVLQFRSFKQPLIIFAAIPLATVGAFPALLVTGYTFSFMAFIGFTSLVGIVVNNSILLVDLANGLRERGLPLREAVQEAGRTRFTPIVLTTLTTVGGLLPLTLTRSDLWSPLGWVIIGGLLVSTVLTLVVVPVLYERLASDPEPAPVPA